MRSPSASRAPRPRHEPPPARPRLRADLLLPDAALAGGVPDLAQLGALHAVPAARPVLAMVRALSRRSAMDRCHLALPLYRRGDRGAGFGAGRAAGLQPGARQVPGPRAGRSPGPGAHHRADHHPLGRGLRPVRQAQADRRVVRPGRGAHRAGAAFRRAGDDGGPARFRPRAGTGGGGAGRQPPRARCSASPCRCCGRAWSRPDFWPSSPRSTRSWWRCSWPAPT